MGRQIIKVAPDEDLYLEWSSIVEAPTFVGTRAEVAAYLLEPGQGEYWPTPEQVKERLRRADETGSSVRRPFGCTWDDHGEIYQQRGFLPRARMAAYAHRLLGDINAQPDDLLEPLGLAREELTHRLCGRTTRARPTWQTTGLPQGG